MTFEEYSANLKEYARRFGSLPDSRLMSDEDHERFSDLVALALIEGKPITDEDLGIEEVPVDVHI